MGAGVLPDTEKPEFTNPIGLEDPLETDYFSKLVKAEQDKKDAQKSDNTVKIASKNDVVQAASGGRVGLLGLLHRRG